jgi:C-terminal processing protease CtpA/Prc
MSRDARLELQAAIDALKQRHMNRSSVDWSSIESRAFALAEAAQKPSDTYGAIWFVIGQLGEKHTHLVPAATWNKIMAGQLSSEGRTGADPMPTSERRGGIGYLTLPPHAGLPASDTKYVTGLRDALTAMHKAGVCRYVVDLRQNTGGSMQPMIAGLSSLLGPPPYGYWDTDDTLQPWDIPNRPLALDGSRVADYIATAPVQLSVWVAVLLDRRTRSAGEFTAIAFEGRPRTRFFGEPSGGFVSTNVPVTLPDGSILAVSTGWSRDRLKRPYRVAVVPDEETSPGDATLAAAEAWLRRQRCR